MQKLLLLIKKYWAPLTLSTLLAITWLSLSPLDKLPPVPGGDKSHHLIAYAMLVFPVALRRPRRWQCITLFFVVYGVAIEFIQPYVNRYGEWLDMVANCLGLVCGILLAKLLSGSLLR